MSSRRFGASPQILVVALLVFPGCRDVTQPDPAPEFTPGAVIAIETHRDWSTESVAWAGTQAAGVVPRFEFRMIVRNRLVRSELSSRYIESATVLGGCADGCFPSQDEGWAQWMLPLDDLVSAPNDGLVAFEGLFHRVPWIHVMPPGGDTARRVVAGRMPWFAGASDALLYVNQGQTAIRRVRPDGTGPIVDLWTGVGMAYPRLSVDGTRLAFSALDGERGSRIYVMPMDGSRDFPDVVSHAAQSGTVTDGAKDRLPTWSPGGRFVAYAGDVQNGNRLRSYVFVTEPDAEPENVVVLHRFEPSRFITDLRWHPTDGRLLLVAVGGDVYVIVPPERYWDAP